MKLLKTNSFSQFFSKKSTWISILAALILAPQFFTGDAPPQLPSPHPAQVYNGDEPHYIVIINSFLNDGDFDLSNNYSSVHAGGNDAGVRWSEKRILDHQVSMPIAGKFTLWSDVYSASRWQTDAKGAVHPMTKTKKTEPPAGTPEYSIHQVGIAVLLAPFLYFFRDTPLLESAAIFMAGLATVFAMLSFRRLLRIFTKSTLSINTVTALTFLGTPVWVYARSLFMEPYLLFFVVSAYMLVLAEDQSILPGILLGLAMQLKPQIAIVAVPLFLYFFLRKKRRQAVQFFLPLLISTVVIFFTYAMFYGSAFHPPQNFIAGNMFAGAVGFLFSPKNGLLFFSPVILLAAWYWPAFFKKNRAPAAVLLGGFLLFFLFMANFSDWRGGDSFGPRYLIPVLPFLFFSLTELPFGDYLRKLRKGSVIALVAIFFISILTLVSVAINGLGAFYYAHYWSEYPAVAYAQSAP